MPPTEKHKSRETAIILYGIFSVFFITYFFIYFILRSRRKPPRTYPRYAGIIIIHRVRKARVNRPDVVCGPRSRVFPFTRMTHSYFILGGGRATTILHARLHTPLSLARTQLLTEGNEVGCKDIETTAVPTTGGRFSFLKAEFSLWFLPAYCKSTNLDNTISALKNNSNTFNMNKINNKKNLMTDCA